MTSDDLSWDALAHLPCPACGAQVPIERDTCQVCSEDLTLVKSAVSAAQRHYNAALQLAGDGLFDAAAMQLESALEFWPRESRFYRLLGTVHARRGMFDQAVQAWERSLELDPGAAAAYRGIQRARRFEQTAAERTKALPWYYATAAFGLIAALALCVSLYTFILSRHENQQRRHAQEQVKALTERLLTLEAIGPSRPPSADAEELLRTVESQNQTLEALGRELSAVRAAAQKLEQELHKAALAQATAEAQIEQLEARLTAATSSAKQAAQELADAHIALASETRLRQTNQQRLEQLLGALGDNADATAVLRLAAERTALLAASAEAAVLLSSREAELAAARHELAALRGGGSAALAQAQEKLAAAEKDRDAAQAELAKAQAALAAALNEAKETAAQLEAARAEGGSASESAILCAQEVARLTAELGVVNASAQLALNASSAALAETQRLRAAIKTYTTSPIKEAVAALQQWSGEAPEDEEMRLLAKFAENELTRTTDPTWVKIQSQVYYEEADALLREEKLDEALRAIDRALEVFPKWKNADDKRKEILRRMERRR